MGEEQKEKDTPEEKQPYIREKIMKKRPSAFRILNRLLLCICMAIIFGAVAGFVFVVVRPWAEQIGNEETETSGEGVTLPTFNNNPGESTDSTTEQSTPEETSGVLDEQELNFNATQRNWIISQIVNRLEQNTPDIEDVEELSRAVYNQYERAARSVAIIRGIDEDGGYFGQILWETTGIVFYRMEESQELLVLVDSTKMQEADHIEVTVSAVSEKPLVASIKGQDHIFNLAVLAVSTEELSAEETAKIRVIELGNVYQMRECDTVLMIGSPYTFANSVAVGNITYIARGCTTLDSVYRLLYTDVSVPAGGTGFMINTNGQLVGILTNGMKSSELQQYAAAIGTEEIIAVLTNMCNGVSGSLLGVFGQDITEEMSQSSGMPQGVYVTDVQVNGPAYNAGISSGDIITNISTSSIMTMSELFNCVNKEHLPGETVRVTAMRESPDGYKSIEFEVLLGGR